MHMPTRNAGHAGRRGGHVRVVLSVAGEIIERLVYIRLLLLEAIQASASVI